MSVLIKGFPLPNNCGACPLRLAWCRERIYMVTRPERCPLVPVPPHGRLIDADAFFDDLLFPSKRFEQGMRELIGDAPTVIPAEPPKDETPTGPYDLLYEEGGANTT